METVLITGGTSGIGYELARIFVQKNYKVILVSSSVERLQEVQRRFKAEEEAEVFVYEQDLSMLGAAEELYNKIKNNGIRVDILINNAGFGLVGRTEEIALDLDEKMIMLNTIAVVELCKLFLPGMYRQGQGKILNVASTGAFQPGPYTSTYFASKAFVLSYSRAVRYEARKKGVVVSVVCPGATRTNFFNREGVDTPDTAMSATSVAESIYKQLIRNKAVLIPGIRNKVMNLLPTKLKMVYVARIKEDV